MIEVVRQGILDTIQDGGRYGYQHLGINPGGAMDRVALSVANSLVGNDPKEAVIELHFPGAAFLFHADALIALSGADFGAMINERPVPINKPVLIPQHTVLRFTKPISGTRCYLAIRGGLALTPWLESYSTHLKAGAGGLEGRPLKKNDRITLHEPQHWNGHLPVTELPWAADIRGLYNKEIRIVPGSEWPLLKEESKEAMTSGPFFLTEQSDRMGFRLRGPVLQTIQQKERLSAGVSRGTIQLLPGGQLIILMADHQTTGGYARVAHVITADMPSLSQLAPHQPVRFRLVTHEAATALLRAQELHLIMLQNASKLRLQQWLLNHHL